MPPAVIEARKSPIGRRAPFVWLAIFAVLACGIAGVAYSYYRGQYQAIEHEVQNELLAVADFKVTEISDWRTQKIDEASVFMADSANKALLQKLTSGALSPAGRAEIQTWLADACRRLHFASANLLDAHGEIVLSVGKVFGDSGHLRQIAAEVMSRNEIVFRDFHLDDPAGAIHLGLNLPLRMSANSSPFGALLLGIDPSDRLYPRLQRWPVPSNSAETLLVRQDGDYVFYLNDLRFRRNAALRLRLPAGGTKLPAALAIRGVQGSVQGWDYRGVPVFAAVRAVPHTAWFLVVKMDAEEVHAPIHRRSILLVAATLALILGAGACVFTLWWRQQMAFYMARQEADLEHRALMGHYEYLARFANDIILLVDSCGRIVEANDRACSTYGYSRDELLQMSVRDLRHSSSQGSFAGEWQQVQERGSLLFETVHQNREGQPIQVEVSGRFIDVSGSQFRQSIIRDISERKALDERLRHMLDAFSAVIDSSPVAIVSLSLDSRVTTWNKAAERMFGWTADEVVGGIAPLSPPEHLEETSRFHARVQQGEVVSGMRTFGQCKDGRTIILSLSAAPLHDSEGRCAGIALNLLDITEQTKAEEALRRNEALYRATFDQAAVGMNYCSLDGRFLRVNPKYCEITGYSQEELLHLRFQDITHLDDLPQASEYGQRLVSRQAATVSQNKRYLRKDGTEVWAQVTASLLYDDSGVPLNFVAVVEDITERLRAEDALRHSEERFRRLVESFPEGIMVERDLRILYANTAAVAMFGAASAAELEGRDSLEFIRPEDHEEVKARSAQVSRRLSVPAQERLYLRVDGTPFPVEVSAAPIEYDQRPASLVFLRDIADRKKSEAEKRQLEEQLRQAQKMESLGRLAGGVAHDFNNHLTVINGYCDMLLGRLEPADPMREEVEEIRAAGGRAGTLTQQLLAFSRKQIAERKAVHLNEVVTESGKMLGRLIGEHVEIVTVLDPALGWVVADHGQMIQILMNLSINARDAMPSGGRIVIETANVDLDREAALRHKAAPGSYVLLSVADTGVGMSAETVQHIFEPFFTSKGMGIGTGLGLSTVYGIVQQSGGWLQVDSRLGEGSRFQIYLPRTAAAPAIRKAVDPPVAVSGGAETVLLAEDQPEVRRLALRILKSNGYQLLEASDGPEALALARSYGGPIQLLVTDVIMPGMTGRELATRLLQSRPEMKVLYVSGYTADVIGREGMLEPGVAYLPKPFTPAQLSIKVREVLGQSKSEGRILVMDDDEAVRGLLQQALTDAGYEVQSAKDGRAGMMLVAEQEFDLVLTDLIMPEQEGIETIRQLRRDYPNVRIVAISGELDGAYLKTAEMLGAHVTLRKPIEPQTLLRIIRELLT